MSDISRNAKAAETSRPVEGLILNPGPLSCDYLTWRHSAAGDQVWSAHRGGLGLRSKRTKNNEGWIIAELDSRAKAGDLDFGMGNGTTFGASWARFGYSGRACRTRSVSGMLPEGVTIDKLSIGVDFMAQVSNPFERRGPSLLDACVFIAAIALGLAVVRSDEIGRVRTWWDPISGGFNGTFRLRFPLVVAYASPFLFFISVAIAALALRSHAGGRKAAMLRPGVAACFMVVVSTILYTIVNPARKLFYGTLYAYDEVSQSLSGLFVQGLLDMTSRAGYLVAALWILQVAAGGGTGRSSWIDKLGRAIGVIWLVFLFSPPLKPAF